MEKRLILTILICVGIALLWQGVLFPPRRPQPRPSAAERPPQAPSSPDRSGGPGAAPVPQAAPRGPERTATVETRDVRAVFSTYGGALKSLVLKGEKFTQRVGGEVRQVDLAQVAPGQPYPLAIAAGAGFTGEWELVKQEGRTVVFRSEGGQAIVEKRFAVAEEGFTLSLDVSGAGEETTIVYPAFADPATQHKGSLFQPPPDKTRPACRVAGATERHEEDAKKPEVQFAGPVQWAGIDQRYFLGAVVPAGAPVGKCQLVARVDGHYSAQITVPSPGGKIALTAYAGPKDVESMEAVGAQLETSIDLGFWALIARVLLWIMRLFHKGVGNWGVAIMLLTLFVKVLLLPLTNKSMKSMEEMRRLQPKVDEIKKKYAKDQQAANMAMMKLYQEHKVNPLGGCLPMLVQMPIWIALYTTLYSSVELYNEPFIRGWIADLTSKDPYYILPVAMTLTMFVTQLLTPTTGQTPQMKYIMYGMPLFFGFLMLGLPAGLTLYIFTNNVLSIGQQIYFKRKYGGPAAAVPVPAR